MNHRHSAPAEPTRRAAAAVAIRYCIAMNHDHAFGWAELPAGCRRRELGKALMAALLAVPIVASGRQAVEAESPMAAIQKIQDLVGAWHGSGKSEQSKGWDEAIQCAWKFKKDGKCGLYLQWSDGKSKSAGRLFDEMAIVYDGNARVYLLKANKAGDESASATVQFRGKLVSPTNLAFDRVEKGGAGDSLDRIDVKILNGGDRIVYTIARRIGQTKRYKQFAQIALDRDGTSLAGGAAKPKCIVTGGAATLTVSYNGQSYPICCTGCREMFLESPEKYIAKANRKAP